MPRFADITYADAVTVPTISELSFDASAGSDLQERLAGFGIHADRVTAHSYLHKETQGSITLDNAYSKEFKLNALANFLEKPFEKDIFLADFFNKLNAFHSGERTTLKMLSSRNYLEDFASAEGYSLDLVRGLIRLARAEVLFELRYFENQNRLKTKQLPINIPRESVLDEAIIWKIVEPIGQYILDIGNLPKPSRKDYMSQLPIIGTYPVMLIRETYSALYGTYAEQKDGRNPKHKSVGALLPYDVEALRRYYEYKSVCQKKSAFDVLALDWYLHPSSAKHTKVMTPLKAYARYIHRVTNIPLSDSHDLFTKPWIHLLAGLDYGALVTKPTQKDKVKTSKKDTLLVAAVEQ